MENIYSNEKPRRKDGNYKVIWYVKIRALSILKIRVLTPPDCFSPPPAQTADNDGDLLMASTWHLLLAILCRHKTIKRNPITEKEANEDAISITLSHIRYQPNTIQYEDYRFPHRPSHCHRSGPFRPIPLWAVWNLQAATVSRSMRGDFLWFDISVEVWHCCCGGHAHLSFITEWNQCSVRIDQSLQFSFLSFIYCRHHIK